MDIKTKELIGVRCISSRPTGSRTTEIINFDDLIMYLEKYNEWELIQTVKKNTKTDSKGRVVFISGCGYDIISYDLFSDNDMKIKEQLYDKYQLDFVGVGKHAHIKNVAEFNRWRRDMLIR